MSRISFAHKIWAVALFCGVIAWLSGPAGRLLVALLLLLFAPGYLIERACCRTQNTIDMTSSMPRRLVGFVRPTLWLGLSLSSIALLYAWTTAFNLSLTTEVVQFLSATVLVGVVWLSLGWNDRNRRAPAAETNGHWTHLVKVAFKNGWLLALFAIFILTVWIRFYQIRELALPAWVDSVHHALLIRVAIEHGQAPYSLRPYLPIDQLPYHWGYHVFMAALVQLSGFPFVRAMLWTGQVLTALHVLTVAGLAVYLWRRPVAGVAAGLVVGLISIMPAYYVSWGRYTQLTGLLLLPALMITWHAFLRVPTRGWLFCAAILLAGLFLIHVRILIFALAYLFVSTLLWAVNKPCAVIRSRFWYAIAGGAIAVVLISPWLWNLAAKLLMPVLERPESLIGADFYTALKPELLWAGQNRLLIPVALAFGLLGIIRGQLPAAEQIGWVICLAVLANPWLLGYLLPALGALILLLGIASLKFRIPGLRFYVGASTLGLHTWNLRFLFMLGIGVMLLLTPALVKLPSLWLITNDVVTISLFIPIGALIGGGVAMVLTWLEQSVRTRWHRLAQLSLAAALGIIAVWRVVPPQDVINPSLVFATQADVEAIEWSIQHTPPDARFLINATPWFPGTPRGTDGGWWLLPLAGRWTSTPPGLITYEGPTEYVRNALADAELVANFHPGQEQQIYGLIQREGINYIYLGSQPGSLSTATFAGDRRFKTVYARDGVTILVVQLK